MNRTAEVNAVLTPAAERFMRRVLRFGAGPEAGFRLAVAPGGCSGFAVGFDLAAGPRPDDVVWEHAGLRIFLDPKSAVMLDGATVDFHESLAHTGFSVAVRGTSPQTCTPASGFVPVHTLGETLNRR